MNHDLSSGDCLVLEGALTMRTADTNFQRLREIIAASQRVLIDCATAEEIDLTFIQMLIAARNTARLSGKNVSLAGPAEGVLLDTLTRAGFAANEAASVVDSSKDFWFESVRS